MNTSFLNKTFRSRFCSSIFLSLAFFSLVSCGTDGPADTAPAAPSIENASAQSYTQGTAISTLAFINNGGAFLTSCSADTLPTGLTLTVSADSSTCEISGTPTATQAATSHTIMATNVGGSDSATLSITVVAPIVTPVISCFGIEAVDVAVCSEHGTCVDNDICDCELGFTGPDCAEVLQCNGVDIMNPAVCSANGVCELDGLCSCDAGWEGANCETEITQLSCNGINVADASVCSGVGLCYLSNLTGEGACRCPDGYLGPDCAEQYDFDCHSTLSSSPMVCSGSGQCIGNDICLCDEGFSGSACQQTVAVTCDGIANSDPGACSGNGICKYRDLCDCFDNFEGDNCETEIATSCPGGTGSDDQNICSGQGICVSVGIGVSQCLCNPRYSGSACENRGWNCYSALLQVTDPGEQSGCQYGNCVIQDRCECEPGWIGQLCGSIPDTYCDFIFASEPDVCAGRGTCVSGMCMCADNHFYGSSCQYIRECNGIDAFSGGVCSGHGDCLQGVSRSLGVCRCDSGYSGSDCEIFSAPSCNGIRFDDPDVCSGNGECLSSNICSCYTRYSGSDCETKTGW